MLGSDIMRSWDENGPNAAMRSRKYRHCFSRSRNNRARGKETGPGKSHLQVEEHRSEGKFQESQRAEQMLCFHSSCTVEILPVVTSVLCGKSSFFFPQILS